MKVKFVCAVIFNVCVAGTTFGQTEDVVPVEEMRTKFSKAAAEFNAVFSETQDKPKLITQPILNWSNPERNTLAGGLFLWTSDSRPVISLCVYPKDDYYDFEFQSLTESSFEMSLNGQPMWKPSTPGLVWREFGKDTMTPHQSPLVRLREMRKIVREFSAKLMPTGRPEKPLRLQSSPVYRYPPKQLPKNCLDGAVFCFVQGTDPEVLVLIEAVQSDAGTPVYRYALTRCTMVPLQVHHQSDLVMELAWAEMGYLSPYTVYKQR